MHPKGHEMDQEGLKYMQKGFSDQNHLFIAQFLSAEFWVTPPPKKKLVCQTKLVALWVTACIWKNLNTFEIIQKIGSHLEKSGQF